VPALAAAYARRTQRRATVLQAIGMALGGPAGARLAPRVGFPSSRDTRLRLVSRLPLPAVLPLVARGVDDWAHRKRQCDGTILVDLTARRPVALLQDREADILASWVRAHPGVTTIARDRLKASMDGARAGALQATQGADRFHLLQNLADAWAQVCSAHGPALTAVREALSRVPVVQPAGRTAMPVPPSTPTPQAQARAAPRRARRLPPDARLWTLHRPGWSNRAMAPPLGLGRRTVVRDLQAPTFPERKGRSDTAKSVLTPEKERRPKRWNAGGRDVLRRFRDLQRHGYPGSDPTVARDAPRLRHAQG